MVDVGEMDTDLVGTARSERDLEQRIAAGDTEPPEFGERLAPARNHRHPLPVLRVSSDGRLDTRRGIGHLADDDRSIPAGHDSAL